MPSQRMKQPQTPVGTPKGTRCVTHELAATRTELQSRMAEWEQLGQALQT